MENKQEIVIFSRSNKRALNRYFYGEIVLLNTSLSKLRKHELNALLLLSIEKPSELCRFLNISFPYLEELINNPVYKHFTIFKKKGGLRDIFTPEKQLKSIQRRLNYFLQAYYLWIKPEAVHGFVVNPHYLGPYCNIAENARVHINKNHVLNIDLKDFFPSISARQVKDIFSSKLFDFKEQISIALALLTTYKGKLPIGAPTSPVISNFICYKLDRELIDFCKSNNLEYTRYADDLTFSSDSKISHDDTLDLINIIKRNDFEINKKKIRLKSSNRKQTVTGLTVNEKVNVDRKLLKKIRAMLHDATKNGIELASQIHFQADFISQRHQEIFIERLRGYINFVGQIRGKNDHLYQRYKSVFNDLMI